MSSNKLWLGERRHSGHHHTHQKATACTAVTTPKTMVP
jgi:hypothetical protein